MAAHRYHLLDVFTDELFGGNQLAVFPDARGVPPDLMPRIARELNLSETVFVLPPTAAGATHHTRIFTPARELAFAGHPSIGTACLLALLGEIPLKDGTGEVVLQQGAGNVPVRVLAPRGVTAPLAQLSAAQDPDIRPSELSPDVIAAILSLDRADVVNDEAGGPAAASCGSAFLFVPLRDRAAIARCELDPGAWKRNAAATWAPHIFVYAFDAERPENDIRARMFAPALGIPEDPATGSAATALAALLASRAGQDGTHRWRMEQGFEMGRPSILELEAEVRQGRVTAARVGGAAVIVGEGVLRLPGG